MARHQGPDRFLQVGGVKRSERLGSPEGDLRGPRPSITGRPPKVRPGGVALRVHAGHRIGVGEAAISAALLRSLRPGPPRLEVLGEVSPRPLTVGLVSGSFDPMTVAHVALARALRERGADPVLLVYAARTMPKGAGAEPPLLTPERRLASLAAWSDHHPGFRAAVCSHGLYADQAEAAGAAFPGTAIVVGLGSDKVLQLFDPAWYEDREAALDRLFRRAGVAYALRAGQEAEVAGVLAANPAWSDRVQRLDLPPEVGEISSAAVRRRLRRGGDVRWLVPAEVLAFLSGGRSAGR